LPCLVEYCELIGLSSLQMKPGPLRRSKAHACITLSAVPPFDFPPANLFNYLPQEQLGGWLPSTFRPSYGRRWGLPASNPPGVWPIWRRIRFACHYLQ
jgi:hypothetical protein